VNRRAINKLAGIVGIGAPMACLDSAGPKAWSAQTVGPAQGVLGLDRDWLFAGKSTAAALDPGYDDKALARVTLPHTVADLSWRKWSPAIAATLRCLPRGAGCACFFILIV
jgi:hypothetical protein